MKTFIAQLRSVQRSFETQICTLHKYDSFQAEMAVLIDAYILISVVIRYLERTNSDIAFEEDAVFTVTRDTAVEAGIDFSASLTIGKLVYADMIDGAILVPDVLVEALTKASFVLLDDKLRLNAEASVSILRLLDEILASIHLSAELHEFAVLRYPILRPETLQLMAELSLYIQRHLSNLENKITFDVDAQFIARTIAYIADYEGKTISSLGDKKLRDVFYI